MKFERPVFVSGKRKSENILDVLPKNLTLVTIDGRFYPKKNMRTAEETIFKEVKYAPYTPNKDVQDLISRPPLDREVSISDLFDLFVDSVEKAWDSKKYHIIGSSSGWDTRVIMKAVDVLHKKNGGEWLGDVVFVELFGEGDASKHLADVYGFDHIVYNENIPSGDYLEEYLCFKNMYKKYHGPVAYPVNQWYDAYSSLHEKGIIPDNTQGFTGYGANETQQTMSRMKMGYPGYFTWINHMQLTLFKYWGGDWEHPFRDIDFLHAMLSNPVFKRKRGPRVSEAIVSQISPETTHIARVSLKHLQATGYRTVSPHLLNKCHEDYKKSWYGKRFDISPNPFVDYTEWWFHYITASFCEHILENGHGIR